MVNNMSLLQSFRELSSIFDKYHKNICIWVITRLIIQFDLVIAYVKEY